VPRIYKKNNLFVVISGPRTYVKWTNSLAKNVKRERGIKNVCGGFMLQ
jgi:hypothetical protein